MTATTPVTTAKTAFVTFTIIGHHVARAAFAAQYKGAAPADMGRELDAALRGKTLRLPGNRGEREVTVESVRLVRGTGEIIGTVREANGYTTHVRFSAAS